jgi:anti-repressor protein
MFNLTISQAKQVLVRESKFVRKAIISYLEELENKSNSIDFSNPDNILILVQNWKQEREEKEKLQKQISVQAAKIEFIDRVLDADEKIDIGQCAKILELPFGRNTMFKQLRERGIFFKNKNEPKQVYVEKGYFQLREKWIERSQHDSFIVLKILVTQKGLGFLSTLFKSETKPKKEIKLV